MQVVTIANAMPVHNAQQARCKCLRLAYAIAKHNTCFRRRYPATHTLYKTVERSLFGTFNDMPYQLVVFAGVVEDSIVTERCDPSEFSQQIASALMSGRKDAGALCRGSRGEVIWRKSLSHVETTLLDEIESAAAAFFASVYVLHASSALREHENTFWKRYQQTRQAHRKARKDTAPIYEAALCLQHVLPRALCGETIRFIF